MEEDLDSLSSDLASSSTKGSGGHLGLLELAELVVLGREGCVLKGSRYLDSRCRLLVGLLLSSPG
jgi:hypothetical protein